MENAPAIWQVSAGPDDRSYGDVFLAFGVGLIGPGGSRPWKPGDEDERFEGGLHIVFGDFGRPNISRSATFVANGVRFRMDPSEVMEVCSVLNRPARPDWMAQIKAEKRVRPVQHWTWTGYAPSDETEITPHEVESENEDAGQQDH